MDSLLIAGTKTFPLDYDDVLKSESSNSDCECHKRYCCYCQLEGREIIETKSTKILLDEVIGSGTYSSVRLGFDVNTGSPLAVKLAPKIDSKGPAWKRMTTQQKESFWLKKADDDQLIGEFKNYLFLNAVRRRDQNRYFVGLPTVYECGFHENQVYMTMDLLGPDLSDLFIACDYRFPLKTVLQITIQLLRNLKYIHECGIVHRDVKPDNCMIGRLVNRTENVIYLADFGNSRELICRKRKAHIRPKMGLSLHGNARFASLNVHLGKEISRRDDLESLCYMIVYFSNGTLPWQGLSLDSPDEQELWAKVAENKRITPASILFDGLPIEFLEFFRYVKRLKFAACPDYDHWMNQFVRLYASLGYSNINQFDWSEFLYSELDFTDKLSV